MKIKILLIALLAIGLAGCKNRTQQNQSTNEIINDKLEIPVTAKEFTEQKYLIKNNGVDIFLIGQNMPTQADGYSITQSIETREEEGDEFEIPIYTVSENGQKMLSIEKYYSDRIDNIFLLSDKFKTAKNIGLHSTIEEFMVTYPDFTIWFSYINGWYVIETEQLGGVQFFLDGDDFIEGGGPKFNSDRTILKPSEFKKGSKIIGIRIWG